MLPSQFIVSGVSPNAKIKKLVYLARYWLDHAQIWHEGEGVFLDSNFKIKEENSFLMSNDIKVKCLKMFLTLLFVQHLRKPYVSSFLGGTTQNWV